MENFHQTISPCKPKATIKHKLRGTRNGPNSTKPIPSGSGGKKLDSIIAEYRAQHGKDWPKDLSEWPGYIALSEQAGYAQSVNYHGSASGGGSAARQWIKRHHPDVYARVQAFRTVTGKPRGGQGHDNAAKHRQAYEPFFRGMQTWMKDHGLVEGVGLEETPGMTLGWQRTLLLAFPTQAELGKRYGVRSQVVSRWLAEDDKFRPLQDICALRRRARKVKAADGDE
ncbi:hypothetical protein [Ralstonia pseudosolanacearum]